MREGGARAFLEAQRGSALLDHLEHRGSSGNRHAVEQVARLLDMKPGEMLEVIALSAGAPTDLPAWCRMTGHTLVSADHPMYVIQRKEDARP